MIEFGEISIVQLKTKEKFITDWEDYIKLIRLLGYSTKVPNIQEEIKNAQENILQLVHKVADEVFEIRESPNSYKENKE